MGGKKNRPKTKWRKVSIGNDTRKGEDQSTTELEAEQENSEDSYTITQNGDSESQNYDENGLPLTNGSEELFEQLPIFQQTPEGLVHIPQNGFFPFPVVVHPTSVDGTTPPLVEAPPPPPEGCVGGCYVNGLWIPNSELFKYGINPPPSTLSSTLVYHPNVPWVRLRPVPGPPPGGHHHNHRHHHHHHNHHQNHHHSQYLHHHHHNQSPTPALTPPVGEEGDGTIPPLQVPPPVPPNSQYLLYFTRKPPPWYQNHPRERGDHNWRRRGSNGGNNPSPYWSFNHASVHHQQLHQHAQPLTMEQCLWNGAASGGGAEEFGALSRYNENLPLEDQLTQQVTTSPTWTQQRYNNYDPAPYIYPGYSFGQPVFTAPVFPVSKSASESRSSRESPATTRSDGESSGVAPQETSTSPASSSSRPSLSSVGLTEVNNKEGSEPPPPPTPPKIEELTPSSAAKEKSPSPRSPSPVPEAIKEEPVEPSKSSSSLILATSQSSVPTVESSPESNQAQRSKKKKKRKKTKASNEMDKVAESPNSRVNGLPSSEESNTPTAIKPDSLDLKLRDESPPKICAAKLTNGELPNFKIDLAGPSRRFSTEEEDSFRATSVLVVSQPFLEFADNLLRSTLEMARKEISDLHHSGKKRESITTDTNQSTKVLQEEVLGEVPKSSRGNAEPASTLASTPLGLNTITSHEIEHGTVSVEGWLSNLESNVRGTFAEKLAERVIRDSGQECRQIGHRPESVPLPVAAPAPIAATVSLSPKNVDPREDGKTTATVEDSSSSLEEKSNEVEGSSSVDGQLFGLVEGDATSSSSQFSRLHRLVRPDSRSLISSSSLECRDDAVENSELTSSPPGLVDSLSNDGNGRSHRHEFTINPQYNAGDASILERVEAPLSTTSLDSSHSIDYTSKKHRVLEEFADRMLYEIAVKIREELVGDSGSDNKSANISVDGGDMSWSEEMLDSTRRSSRDFDSLGSIFDRRFSVSSYHGGEKYVDEATANYLAHLLPPSETLIRETEQELNSLQSRVLGNAANHSIYKLAYDEVITDPSDSDASPYTSLTSAQGEQHPEVNDPEPLDINHQPPEFNVDDPILIKDLYPQRFEIMVHEADSMSEAGSEDVELIPHMYESGTTGEKHIYVNRLSLATELLRTKEELPYDNDFKPVTEEPTKTREQFRGDDQYGVPDTPIKRGKTNEGFVGDEMPLSVITSGPRASTMSTADSGVQSEEDGSGDEVAEEAIEGQKDQIKDATTSEEDQGQGQGYRRMGAKTARLGTIPGGGPWDPCLCCCVM